MYNANNINKMNNNNIYNITVTHLINGTRINIGLYNVNGTNNEQVSTLRPTVISNIIRTFLMLQIKLIVNMDTFINVKCNPFDFIFNL